MEDNSKKCSSCQQVKLKTEFNKCSRNKGGLHNHCKECQKKIKREWYIKNKDHIKEYSSRPDIKEAARKRANIKYHSDPVFRKTSLEKNRILRRSESAKIKQRINEKFRRLTNINYKLSGCLRARLGAEIKKIKFNLNAEVSKCAKTINLLGCSLSEFKVYLESKFLPGMTWENHGFGDDKWHIDHILPCASFDLTKEEDQRKCFHYSNMQPLWQFDNLSKNDKIL